MKAKTVVRPPKIFLAYASEDRRQVLEFYQKLRDIGLDPWMDKKNLIGGQNWKSEIPKAVNESDFFIACLSKRSIDKQSYVQQEFRLALTKLSETPSNKIYMIPVRFNRCEVPDLGIPELGVRLKSIQWIDLFEPDGFENILKSIETHSTWIRKHVIGSEVLDGLDQAILKFK